MFARRMLTVAALFGVVGVLAACTAGGGTSRTSSPPSASDTSSPSASATPPPTAQSGAIAFVSPAEGATVSVPFVLAGDANTFEAALTIDALDAGGDILCMRQLMATSGSGTPGTWSGTLAFPPPEAATPVTLRAYASSSKDGSMIDLVEREVTVSAERPAIFLTTPVCGDRAAPGGTVAITGRAAVFEAALVVEVRDAMGVVVLSQPVMADECCVEANFGTYVVLPADLTAGNYDVVAFNNSAADGSIQNEFAVQIQVQP